MSKKTNTAKQQKTKRPRRAAHHRPKKDRKNQVAFERLGLGDLVTESVLPMLITSVAPKIGFMEAYSVLRPAWLTCQACGIRAESFHSDPTAFFCPKTENGIHQFDQGKQVPLSGTLQMENQGEKGEN